MFYAVLTCFSTYLGIGYFREGVPPKALVHNTLMHFFAVDSSKIEAFETYFLILWSPKMTIQNEQSMF